MSSDGPIPKSSRERRASRRNAIHVRVNLSDTQGSFSGRSVDVSRGGLFVLSTQTRRVGTLLRIRVLAARGEAVFAVGVVVRCFSDLEGSTEGTTAMAIALTSTSEAWDRFWDDVNATDDEDEEDPDASASSSERQEP